MTTTRRGFLQTTAIAAAAAGISPRVARAADESGGDAPEKLKILILGGTGFLGPATVEYALERGHTLTLFNRGKSGEGLFPEVERLVGDREGDIESLKGREWDAVIDNTGYVPGHVEATAGLLADHAKHYVFVSSISVYADNSKPMDEDSALATVDPEVVSQVTKIKEAIPHYGGMKALCEQAAEKAFPGRCTVVRPGLIVGPMDKSDRFTYWPARIARGGEVLAPGTGKDPVQFIDVRDLGAWIVRLLENKVMGAFNATSAAGCCTMGTMLDGIRGALESQAKFTWVPADFLAEKEVAPWQHMPVWIPAQGEYRYFHLCSVQRAVDAGLTFRPLAETVRDTMAWFKTLPDDRRLKLRAGLTAEREAEVLAAWHKKRTGEASAPSAPEAPTPPAEAGTG